MNLGRTVFAQLLDYIPSYQFQVCVDRYQGNRYVKNFSCWDQFLCLVFAQLTYRESLRDIEACLRTQQSKLYHMGWRGRICRNTLAHANEVRDWRIYADFAHVLIGIARELYRDESFDVDLSAAVYVLDSTSIDLCLSLFPWAAFRHRRSSLKMHTLLDLRGIIPTNVYLSGGHVHDVNFLDQLRLEAGAFYLFDRAYVDFARLYGFTQACAFFVTRAKKNYQFKRQTSRPVDRSTGVRCDQTVRLSGPLTTRRYPAPLRRIAHFRRREGSAAGIPNQPFSPARPDHCPTLSSTLAGRIVLPLDQTAPAHQDLLRHLGERRQDSGVGCALRLRPGGDCQKAARARPEPLQNSPNSQRHEFRKNSDFTGILQFHRWASRCRSLYPIEPV